MKTQSMGVQFVDAKRKKIQEKLHIFRRTGEVLKDVMSVLEDDIHFAVQNIQEVY